MSFQLSVGAAVLHGDFTLRSGRKSTYYLDKYLFSTQPEILTGLGALFAERIPPETDRLAGAELGGIPLVSSASMATGKPCSKEIVTSSVSILTSGSQNLTPMIGLTDSMETCRDSSFLASWVAPQMLASVE